jgi:hypothetical protein
MAEWIQETNKAKVKEEMDNTEWGQQQILLQLVKDESHHP